MELLNRSMSDLGHTLQNNRALTLQDRDRQDRRKLDEEMMRIKRDDMASDRSFKEREVTAREEQTANQEKWRTDMLKNQQVQAGIKQVHDFYTSLETGVKNGTISPDVANARARKMVETMKQSTLMVLESTPFAALLDGDKDIFKLPEKGRMKTREENNLELAEQYRQRAAAAAGPAGGGNSDRYLSIADRLERGGAPEPDDMATITEKIMDEGADQFAEPRATVTRKVPSSRLSEEMGKMKGTPVTPPPAATATTPAAAGATERVTVVAPDGKRGTIPKAQLQQALKEGYKLAQ